MKLWILNVILIMMGMGLTAQELEGKIENFDGSLEGAKVSTVNQAHSVTTNDDGEFEIPAKEGQKQQFVISANGYETDTVTLTVTNDTSLTHVLTPVDADYTIRVYKVFGMGCPGCHGGAEKRTTMVDPVIGARANWLQKKVVLKVKKGADLTDQAVHEAIKEANLTPGKRIQ